MRFVPRRWRYWCGVAMAFACCLIISWYAWSQERTYRNLHVVKQGVLYRSGQLTRKGLERALHEFNVGTLVNLRARDAKRQHDTTAWEAKLCEKQFMHFAAIPLGSPEEPHKVTRQDAERVIDDSVRLFLAILDSPERYPRPILVHCLGGVHRTGVMVAIYRMEYDGWSKEKALAEMRDFGYDDFESYDPLRDYVVNWTPRRERPAVSREASTGQAAAEPHTR